MVSINAMNIVVVFLCRKQLNVHNGVIGRQPNSYELRMKVANLQQLPHSRVYMRHISKAASGRTLRTV